MNVPPRHDAPPDRSLDEVRFAGLERTRHSAVSPKATVLLHQASDKDIGPATAGATEAFVALRLREISGKSGACFGNALLANPAWDILLDLFVRRSESRPITVDALCDTASAPPATVKRYLNALDEAGLVICGSSGDVTSPLITLTDDAFERMKAVLS